MACISYECVTGFIVSNPSDEDGFTQARTLSDAIKTAKAIMQQTGKSVSIQMIVGVAIVGRATPCMCGASGERVDRTEWYACPTCHAV